MIKDIIRLDYQELRQNSPAAARRAILQVLKAQQGNVSKTARIMNVTRATVYKALKKKKWGDLNDRSRLGDWEADAIFGLRKHQAIVTVSERKTRFTLKTSQEAVDALIEWLRPYPVLTLTVDNGKEFMEHRHCRQISILLIPIQPGRGAPMKIPMA